MLLLVAGVPSAWGFSLWGPTVGGDTWQTPVIDYNTGNGPKNIGEGYRRNTPVLYYTYDANFLTFFGSNGVSAVDGAFQTMNAIYTNNPTGMTNGLDGYSPDLSEFPFYSTAVNYSAQSLGLTDLKSVVLAELVTQMGLTDPVRYVWTLRQRNVPPGCPLTTSYLVIQRNFDITPSPLNSPIAQTQYTSYINDVLYSYHIFENCTGPNPLAGTIPFPADPFALVYAPLSTIHDTFLDYGYFYTGLTLDDVAGLRYLLTTNNIATEDPAAGALLLTTNLGATTIITSSTLNTLLVSAQTTDPLLIPVLFPGVTVTASSNYWTWVCTPNVVSYFTNYYGSPYGSPPVLVVVTNGYTCGPQQFFVDTFGGIIINASLTNTPNIVLSGPNIILSYYTNTPATLVTVSLGTKYGQPYPAPVVTNATTKSIILTNGSSGEYLVLPANQCGWKILSVLGTNVVASTNFITVATNTVTTATNAPGTAGFVGSVSIITYFTNHTFLVQAINCVEAVPAAGLYEGIEKMQFVYAPYDSLLSQTFQPVTNNYTMTLITNSQTVLQKFRRVATVPDILLSASDTATAGYAYQYTIPDWDSANILQGLAGPGTINPRIKLTFDKVGPLYANNWAVLGLNPLIYPFPGIGETNQTQLFVWASFDSSTNDPVAYPSGTSIQNLINQVVIQVSPAVVSDGTNAVVYAPVTFTTTGGGAFVPPFTWSATGLPFGLTVTTDVNGNGYLSGTPTQSGTFDFTLLLTDHLGRSVSWQYSITIH